MKTKFFLYSVLLTLSLLTGCASGPGYEQYAEQIKPTQSGDGRLYIYRTAIIGTAIQPDVRVNGEVVGSAQPQGFFYVDRPAGQYEISTSTEAKRSLTLNLDPGEEKYIRLEIKMGLLVGHVKPVLVETSEGQAEIKDTKYIGMTQ